MHDDLDLRVIERHHDAETRYREELRRRVAAILDGSEAASPTDGSWPDSAVIDLDPQRQGRSARRRHWLGAAVAIAGAAAATVAILVAIPPGDEEVSTTDRPVQPTSSFVGEWITDDDTGTPTMTIDTAANGTLQMRVLDNEASVCAGAPSTMTGTGAVNSSGDLVIAAPELTCDDGNAPQALGELPLEEQLRNLTFTSAGNDTLTDSLGSTWQRVEAKTTPTVVESEEQTSDGMWPQTTLGEVRAAQELADAGDPDYTWQLEPQLTLYEEMTIEEPGRVELVERFLREVLGWEAYLFDSRQGGLPDGRTDGALPDQRFHRCAPGRTNPLYPPGPEPEMGELCAPTLDDLRYESVSLDLAQLDRVGLDGIWVVNRWRLTAPFAQVDPVANEAQATERLEDFLAARIAGNGAEAHVQVDPDVDIPLLYGTTSGAPYERYEVERVDGPQWPDGYMTFSARLFADGDATVVEQQFNWEQSVGLSLENHSTTENGQPIVLSYTSSDGEVTVSAPSTWQMWWPDAAHAADVGVWFGGLWHAEDHFGSGKRVEFVDPVAYDSWCARNGGSPVLSAPAGAAAIAQQVVDDPNFETTAPVAARVGGVEAVSIDVALAADGRACGVYMIEISRWIHSLGPGLRLRLYLVDLPEGMSVETLAITVVAPEDRFDEVIAETAPIIESIEFHPR